MRGRARAIGGCVAARPPRGGVSVCVWGGARSRVLCCRRGVRTAPLRMAPRGAVDAEGCCRLWRPPRRGGAAGRRVVVFCQGVPAVLLLKGGVVVSSPVGAGD